MWRLNIETQEENQKRHKMVLKRVERRWQSVVDMGVKGGKGLFWAARGQTTTAAPEPQGNASRRTQHATNFNNARLLSTTFFSTAALHTSNCLRYFKPTITTAITLRTLFKSSKSTSTLFASLLALSQTEHPAATTQLSAARSPTVQRHTAIKMDAGSKNTEQRKAEESVRKDETPKKKTPAVLGSPFTTPRKQPDTPLGEPGTPTGYPRSPLGAARTPLDAGFSPQRAPSTPARQTSTPRSAFDTPPAKPQLTDEETFRRAEETRVEKWKKGGERKGMKGMGNMVLVEEDSDEEMGDSKE